VDAEIKHDMDELIQIQGDTAILIGKFTVRQAGGTDSAPQRATVTYVKRQGQWKALAEDISNISLR
jgi:hypothetical protein